MKVYDTGNDHKERQMINLTKNREELRQSQEFAEYRLDKMLEMSQAMIAKALSAREKEE